MDKKVLEWKQWPNEKQTKKHKKNQQQTFKLFVIDV